jgi:uncharacterized protein YcbK (DUF882 family)
MVLSLLAGAATLPFGVARAMPLPNAAAGERRLRLVNAHTGETFSGPYRNQNGPLPQAMADLAVFLRDFRADATVPIDVKLVDFLASVMEAVGADRATVLSGYRTPQTNAMLARTTFGVAENSQHMYGRAVDVYFPARLSDAAAAARAMARGGVGWYPSSHFIHLDSGAVRSWELDGNGFGSLLVGGRRLHLDARHDEPAGLPYGRLTPEAAAQHRSLSTAELLARAHRAELAGAQWQ